MRKNINNSKQLVSIKRKKDVNKLEKEDIEFLEKYNLIEYRR